MNFIPPGRTFRGGMVPPQRRGLGELPSTALVEGGTLDIRQPIGLPPSGNDSAPVGNGEMRQLGPNQSSWQFSTFSAQLVAIKVQDFMYRKFLVIQNKDGAGTLYVGFGWIPTPGNGLVLGPGVGYEPYSYPINEIYVLGSIANVSGLLIYGV